MTVGLQLSSEIHPTTTSTAFEKRTCAMPPYWHWEWRWGLGETPYRQMYRRLGAWVNRYPEMHVRPAAARAGAAKFLAGVEEPVQLAVVGSAESSELARIVGPPNRSLLGAIGCSVLVVRRRW